MSKGKLRRTISIVVTLVIALLYIVLNKDIVQVIDNSTINNQIASVTKAASKADETRNTKEVKVKSEGFFLSSHKEDVRKALGNPTKEETKYLNQWYYDESIIYFDDEDKVIGYNNLGELSLSLMDHFDKLVRPTSDEIIFIDSDKEVVKAILGPPTYIDPLRPDVWKYKNSTIHFTMKDQVDGYLNYYGEISEYLPIAKDPDNTFTIGSTKSQVLGIMGAPSLIESYHLNIWIYKLAKVYFDENDKVIEVDDGYKDLKFVE